MRFWIPEALMGAVRLHMGIRRSRREWVGTFSIWADGRYIHATHVQKIWEKSLGWQVGFPPFGLGRIKGERPIFFFYGIK